MGISKGRFIVFEGIDGSGKSTQIHHIAKRLRNSGHKVYTTFEPTDGPVGSLIRKMLEGSIETDQRTIACLFAADRTDHLTNSRNGIRAKIDNKEIVLCDRYYFSSYAYHAQYIDMDWVIAVNSLNAEILKPDITIFIDADPETCFERIKKGRTSLEMYEKMDIMQRVRENYVKAFEKLEGRENIAVVDGNQTAEKVELAIMNEIGKLEKGLV